jgi:hypothetical protein
MRCCFLIGLFLLSSLTALCQSLAELEKQLDSLLKKKEKSEFIFGLGYGNTPSYGKKTQGQETPYVMKSFVSPTIGYYNKSGLYATVSSYHLFNASGKSLFEWDFSAGYDYAKSKRFLTGISYTKYIFTDSADIPVTPINNELFAYFYYRDWWIQPGVSLDLGWGSTVENIGATPDRSSPLTRTLSGTDFNIVVAVRHPFVFIDVLKFDDAVLLTPSFGLTTGTANYYSNLKAFQYISRSSKLKGDDHERRMTGGVNHKTATGFEVRALDLTLNVSYMIGNFTISPSYTIFKPFQGEDKSITGYFTARLGLTLK